MLYGVLYAYNIAIYIVLDYQALGGVCQTGPKYTVIIAVYQDCTANENA